MKMQQFRTLVLTVVILFSYELHSKTKTDGDQTITKTAELVFPVKAGHALVFDGSSIELQIETWERDEVQLTATAVYKGKESKKMTEFLDAFQQQVASQSFQSGDRIDISADLEVPNKVQVGSRFIGVQISYGDDELDIYYALKVPSYLDMDLKDSYKDVSILGDYQGNISLEHYSGDVRAGNFEALKLELKYGEAKLQSVNNGQFVLYEQELEVEQVSNLRLDMKYSQITSQELNTVQLEAYESELTVGRMADVTGEIKYTKINSDIGIQTLTLTASYESQIKAKSIGRLQNRDSKYCQYEAVSVDHLEMRNSYEDKYTFGYAGEVLLSGKYLELIIMELGQSLALDGYEAKVSIDGLSDKTELIQIDGKYNVLELETGTSAVKLDIDVEYGEIDFDKSQYTRKVYIKDDSDLIIEAESKNFTGPSMTLMLRGYEFNATIN
ncbi:MAG: hypothetical protein ACI8QD_001076 [Cyclobacteriaceae bacterium]|jgi:hypothetical protein